MGRLPRELDELLTASPGEAAEAGWARFIARHSRLFLKVAHENSSRHDDAMDRYVFVLERLRADGFRRLRRYEPDGRTKFTTWLVVVARRLCLDHHRHVYGRLRGGEENSLVEHRVRRRLVDFVMEEIDPERTVNGKRNDSADRAVRYEELMNHLAAAVSDLPADERLLLRLRYEDGASVSDIAKILSVPTVFHVYRRINKTLARLRVELERRGVDGPNP